MHSKLYLILALVVMCLAGWTAHAKLQRNTPERQTWEYAAVELESNFPTAAKLNNFGVQGWELVAVMASCPSIPDANPGCKHWAYLKRAK